MLEGEPADDWVLAGVFKHVSQLDLPTTYSARTHESVLLQVKSALMEGEISPIRPCFVANALWDAVLSGRDYLNENASFLSVLKWLESNEIYDIVF